MSTNWETADILKSPMEVCWQFDYEIDLPKLKNLYGKAKEHQWDAESLDWDREIDPSKPLIDESQFRFKDLSVVKKLSMSSAVKKSGAP